MNLYVFIRRLQVSVILRYINISGSSIITLLKPLKTFIAFGVRISLSVLEVTAGHGGRAV
jgi:hypothetical protein